jgi:CheY-like chemotaxis protein
MKLMTATSGNGKMKKILIVDDERDICTVLKMVLEQHGFNAEWYDDPILALENFKAGLYELLLLDIKMPEMGGFLLYREMKKIDNKTKVCFLTASEMYHEKFREKERLSVLIILMQYNRISQRSTNLTYFLARV